MAKVNLLPHRAERRRERQQKFWVMLGVAAAVGLAVGLTAVFYYSGQIDGQTNRNNYLTAEISKLDDQIAQIKDLDKQRGTLLRRKEVIETLQSNRSQMVHLFDQLVRTIPEGVRLTSVKQDGNKLTLEGLSQSNARVSAYMRNIEASGWMTNPDLSVIEVKAGDKTLPYAFNLSLTLIRPGQQLGPDGQPLPDNGVPKGGMASPPSTSPAASGPASATTPPPAASSKKGGSTP